MKSKPKIFRVLVVDDKKPVLQAIGDLIERNITVADEDYLIQILPLYVEVNNNGNSYSINKDTIKNLYDYCDKPFQLLLLDFGYVKEGVKTVEELYRLQKLSPQKTIRQLIDEVVLNPTHLISNSAKEQSLFKRIEKYFVQFSGSLYVYTFLPSKIEKEYTSADVRKNITNNYFPKANIKVIDTRKTLFNDTQFENKYDPDYYPFLISKFLSNIIHIEIAESLLENTKQLRSNFKIIKRNNKIITASTILPSLIAGFFVPSFIKYIDKGEYLIAFSFLSTSFLIIIISTIFKKIMERKNYVLIK